MSLREIEARLAGISVNEENLNPSSGLHKAKVHRTLASTRAIFTDPILSRPMQHQALLATRYRTSKVSKPAPPGILF